MKKRIKRLKDERMLVKTFWSETYLSETLGKTKTSKKRKKTVLGVFANYKRSYTEVL